MIFIDAKQIDVFVFKFDSYINVKKNIPIVKRTLIYVSKLDLK
jgi:hypothetical protein